MLSAISSQTDANASSSVLTIVSSVRSASSRYMAACSRRRSGQSFMPNTVPLCLESRQSIVELSFNMLNSYGADIGIRLVKTTQLHVRKAADPSSGRDRAGPLSPADGHLLI